MNYLNFESPYCMFYFGNQLDCELYNLEVSFAQRNSFFYRMLTVVTFVRNHSSLEQHCSCSFGFDSRGSVCYSCLHRLHSEHLLNLVSSRYFSYYYQHFFGFLEGFCFLMVCRRCWLPRSYFLGILQYCSQLPRLQKSRRTICDSSEIIGLSIDSKRCYR